MLIKFLYKRLQIIFTRILIIVSCFGYYSFFFIKTRENAITSKAIHALSFESSQFKSGICDKL